MDPALIDPTNVDLSNASILFHGPVELYVTGIGYEGFSYAAVLEYDGSDSVHIRAPEYFHEGLPAAIDLPRVSVELVADGIRLNDVIIDYDRYSGVLAPTVVPAHLILHWLWVDAARDLPTAAVTNVQLESEIDDLRRELAESERLLRQKDAEIRQLGPGATKPAWATANDRLTRVRLSGFCVRHKSEWIVDDNRGADHADRRGGVVREVRASRFSRSERDAASQPGTRTGRWRS